RGAGTGGSRHGGDLVGRADTARPISGVRRRQAPRCRVARRIDSGGGRLRRATAGRFLDRPDMKLLLDTHAFMWWDSDPSRLSSTALAAVRDPANEVWVSVVCVWEMAIKSQLGKLQLRLPLADIVAGQQVNGLRVLNVSLSHVLGVEALPLIHKDPFDRLLIGPADGEGA